MIPLSRRSALQIVGLLALLLGGFHLCSEQLARPWVVAGRSMSPALGPGDRVVVDLWTYRHREPRPGEVVLFRGPPPRRTALVKRVAEPRQRGAFRVSAEVWGAETAPGRAGVWVLGDNRRSSEDSRRFGAVPRDAIVGRVVWCYWPPSRAGRLR